MTTTSKTAAAVRAPRTQQIVACIDLQLLAELTVIRGHLGYRSWGQLIREALAEYIGERLHRGALSECEARAKDAIQALGAEGRYAACKAHPRGNLFGGRL